MEKVSLAEGFDAFDEQWSPRLVAEPNDHAVELAKVEGEFVWHSHPDTDELFFVHDGTVTVEFRDRDDVTLRAGELLVVPSGVEHRPVADEEAQLVLFEAAGTRNTGTTETEHTQTETERLNVD